jgi:hypothetical protein
MSARLSQYNYPTYMRWHKDFLWTSNETNLAVESPAATGCTNRCFRKLSPNSFHHMRILRRHTTLEAWKPTRKLRNLQPYLCEVKNFLHCRTSQHPPQHYFYSCLLTSRQSLFLPIKHIHANIPVWAAVSSPSVNHWLCSPPRWRVLV